MTTNFRSRPADRFLSSARWAVALLVLLTGFVPPLRARAQASSAAVGRERLLMDFNWRFAFGHPFDAEKDFGTGTGYFSYLAKTGYGDGAAAAAFDDRAWRTLDLPHDWAVEVPFDGRGSHSHGYKAIGRNFPDTSVGWYRKAFFIPATDLGRRISVEFDGVYRDSKVWINGHYLGTFPSGYTGIACNLTEFLNYGGTNVLAVRADATMEEGWFYEGAGIYRHVWLVKTDPLHVQRYGTCVTTELKGRKAVVAARVAIVNEITNTAKFNIEQTVLDSDGNVLAKGVVKGAMLDPQDTAEFSTRLSVSNPKLWSIDNPYMHRLVTTIRVGSSEVDRFETPFGIRSIRFDPNDGFFLNGKRVELTGADNHQDHAGVGVAIPDALQEFRIRRLKEFGCNAYRCSHNPPTPELLDACDRLGMVVIDENRLMGTSEDQLGQLRQMILRDRNHPSVILWSVGNEEWAIEGNIKGARITSTMQAFTRHLDPTRQVTVAISGGWGGSSTVIEVAGYNYIKQSNSDRQHKEFPNQAGVGTEETTTQQTRGIYFDDRKNAHLAPLAHGDSGGNCEVGWKYYDARPYLAGLFYWTGFDYRGEETPFGYPAISSQFGILDTCGFPKDSYYYLQSWWTGRPVLHLSPHWNWAGQEGQDIPVRCFGNCEQVELLLNGQSLGRKALEKNGHLEWNVKYAPGVLTAVGYRGGAEIIRDKVETTGDAAAVRLVADRKEMRADAEDVTVFTVSASDSKDRLVPTASNHITFRLTGPGKIIGVGNGDPSCHEPDRLIDDIRSSHLSSWRRQGVDSIEQRPEVAVDFDDSNWQVVAESGRGNLGLQKTNVFRGYFELPEQNQAKVSLLMHPLGGREWIYLNGNSIAAGMPQSESGVEIDLDPSQLRAGTNVVAVLATPRTRGRGRREQGDARDEAPLVKLVTPAGDWSRSLFNGLAQVIVQSTGQSGEISLVASSPGLTDGESVIRARVAALRPAIR